MFFFPFNLSNQYSWKSNSESTKFSQNALLNRFSGNTSQTTSTAIEARPPAGQHPAGNMILAQNGWPQRQSSRLTFDFQRRAVSEAELFQPP